MTRLRQPGIVRNIFAALALSALLFPAFGRTLRAQAQGGDDLKLAAQVGFDGYCKEDHWLPVHILVENRGADLSATVQLTQQIDANRKTVTSAEVSLPATSRKEFFLYMRPQRFTRDLNVSLRTGRTVLRKIDLRINCLSSENMLFGLLSDSPANFNLLNTVQPLSGSVRVAQLEIFDLPDRAQAWSSLDALIVSNVDTGTLTPEQKQALESWVVSGGKLLITGGINWQGAVAGLKDVAPIEPSGARRVRDLSQLQAYFRNPIPLDSEAVLTTGRLRKGAQVLVEQDGIPLLVTSPMGFGAIHYLAADPALRPLSEWDGMEDLYAHLLGSRPALPRWVRGAPYNYSASQALGAISELGLPSVVYICCLLGFYVIVIGPLNYFALRRMKRRELAWGTIPAFVIIFSCVAYGSGFLYRGRTPILNRLVVAQAWDGVDRAQARALVGVYSPVRAKYDLEAADQFLFQPFEGENGYLQASNNWEMAQQGSDTVLPDVRVEIGGMRAVELEGSLRALALSHNMVLKLNQGFPILSGTIDNRSDKILRDAMLVTPGSWQRLGDIPAGESKTVSLSLAPGANGPEFYSLDSMTILNMDYMDIQTKEDAARRNAFLATVLAYDYRMNDANWGIYLMGWVDEPVLPVGLRGQRFKTVDTMLYVHQLSPSIKTDPGPLTLPATLFLWESSTPTASPYYTSQIPPGGYVLRFKPAFPIHFRNVQSLGLFLRSNTLPEELITSLWDYESGEWVQVDTQANSEIPDADRYVGPDNEVMMHVVTNRSDWTEVTASYITLVVEP